VSEALAGESHVPARHRAVLVLGPGRSGTSALTRGIEALGVTLGERLKPAMRKNARGFFEDLDLVEINYRLHTALCLRRNGSSVRLLTERDWAEAELGDLEDEAIALIRRRFGDCPLWGFKCVGVMRLLPFWEAVLEAAELDLACVVAIRNPISVARSRARLDVWRAAQEKSDLEWLTQVVPYFERVRKRPFVVVDYDDLLDHPKRELHKIAAALALPDGENVAQAVDTYADEFLASDLRHNRATPADLDADPRVNPLTRDAYGLLLQLARGEARPDAERFRSEWARIENSLAQMAPVLRHLDVLEDAVRRRGPSMAQIWKSAWQHLPVRATWPVLVPRLRTGLRRMTGQSA